MTLARVKAAGWGLGEKLTSAQQTAVDLNIENALDKRSGETDTLASLVSLATGGRFVALVQAGADADGSYLIANGQAVRVASGTLTTNRIYTLSTTGALDGDEMTVEVDTGAAYYVTVQDGGGMPANLTTLGLNGAAFSATFRFNGTVWELVSHVAAGLVADVFTSSGTWTCPSYVTRVLLVGVGGGGGGGGGSGHGAGIAGGGGGGGGGALFGICSVGVSANQTVTVGSAGSAGAAGVTGNDGGNGGDGGDTTFGALATFRGAQGAKGGDCGALATGDYAPGGGPVRAGGYINPSQAAAPTHAPLPGFGGWGTPAALNAALRTGGGSALLLGAANGSDGASSWGGGGGGASGYLGGAAGAGGGGSSGSGVAGVAGTAGTLGCGGGGGGGSWPSGGASGGAGGAGGAGALVVIYSR